MSLVPTLDGYYDENGLWTRTKYCFVSCGESCTCVPHNGVYVLTGDELDDHLAHLNDIANP